MNTELSLWKDRTKSNCKVKFIQSFILTFISDRKFWLFNQWNFVDLKNFASHFGLLKEDKEFARYR